MARAVEIRKSDVLVVQAKPDGIEGIVGALGLAYARKKSDEASGPCACSTAKE